MDISLFDYAYRHSVDIKRARAALRARLVPGAQKIKGAWSIPETAGFPWKEGRQRHTVMGCRLVAEFANRVGTAVATVEQWCRDGRLFGAQQIGGVWYIPGNVGDPRVTRVRNPPSRVGNRHQQRARRQLSKLYFRRRYGDDRFDKYF